MHKATIYQLATTFYDGNFGPLFPLYFTLRYYK